MYDTEGRFDYGWNCQQDDAGRSLNPIPERGLCPVCGVKVTITGETTDGRLIGSCQDAFTVRRWVQS
jgi:hypothetical protein